MKDYRSYSDLELSELLRLNDELAFREIYQRYNGLLYIHTCKKLQNNEEAKDIIQEVFVMLWDKRKEFKIRSNLVGFLYTCIHHKILDHIGRLKTADKYVTSLQVFLHGDRCSTDHLVREKQLSEIIEREIAELPEKMRIIFELSRNKHLSHKEIAIKLGISQETVKSQIKNALKLLRLRLGILIYIWFMIKF